MLISIITVCYNRKETIKKTIESVLNQDYTNFEYIIIDGNSTDGTKEIITSYKNKIQKIISEPDFGMYDAINKGLSLATGDIVGLMHSDDTFYDNGILTKIATAFKENPKIDGVYGNGIYITNNDAEKIVRNRICGNYSIKRIKRGWLPLHTTVYLKNNCIKKYGFYNLDFRIASDTEFLLRYLHKNKIKMFYIPSYFVKMKMGGLSTNYKRAFEVLFEDYKIYKYYKLPAFKVVFLKKLYALKQYLTT